MGSGLSSRSHVLGISYTTWKACLYRGLYEARLGLMHVPVPAVPGASATCIYLLEFVLPNQKNIGGEQCIGHRGTGRIESKSHVVKMRRH